MKAAVVQMVSNADVVENLSNVGKWMAYAKQTGASLVVLPENFSFIGRSESEKLNVAEEYQCGEIQQTVAKLAKAHGLWVIAGTIAIKSSSHVKKIKSASIVFDDKGQIVTRYDKIHLFDVWVGESESYLESAIIYPGSTPVVVDTPIGKVGLSVCYDLRFPELYQRLREMGATVFSIPAAFTATTGLAHWQVLLRARAIENLCYVLAANQGGVHDGGRATYGHSMIIEPWGEIKAQASVGPACINAEIDIEKLNLKRQQFPCQNHHVLSRGSNG